MATKTRKRFNVKLKQYGVRINGILVRKSFASATAARIWQRQQKEMQDEIRAGIKRRIAPTFLSVHAADFLRARKHQAQNAHQVTWMGKYILVRIDAKDKLLNDLGKPYWKKILGPTGDLIKVHGLAPATHNHIRAMLHKMYEDARTEHEPPRAIENPIHDIPELPVPKKKIPILKTKDEIRRYIIAAYRDPVRAWGIYVAIKLNTGMRRQNIMVLRWQDWNEADAELMARFKYTRRGILRGHKAGEDERMTGVNSSLRTALLEWRQRTPHSAPGDFIVCGEAGGHLTEHQVYDAHQRSLKRAGLPYLSEHKMRHTYASHYLSAGGQMHDLKVNLFHSSITTTEKYAQALQSETRKRASVFIADVQPALENQTDDQG